MFGFLPPNSSESFLNIGPAMRAISAPVLVPPVNETALIFGCFTIAAPTVGPTPSTMFITAGGRPASLHNSPSMNAVIGVISDGLATTVLPVARAGAIFHVNKYNGKFHGEMHPATP